MSRTDRPDPPATREELLRIADEIASAYPETALGSSFSLLEVDPYHVHAYWTVLQEDLAAARLDLGPDAEDATLVIRLHDATADPLRVHDIEVQGARGSHYIAVARADRTYFADLGWRRPGGSFRAVVRSNPVTVPKAAPANRAGTAEPVPPTSPDAQRNPGPGARSGRAD